MTTSEKPPSTANGGSGWFNLRAFAIAFGVLNALAAAAAVFGAVVYVGEAEDRQLERDTFQALAVEMLFARLDRSRRTYSDSSNVLARLSDHGVGISDLDLSFLVFREAPAEANATVFLRGEGYYIDCPVGDDSFLGATGEGRVGGCEVSGLTLDVQNPVTFDVWNSTLDAPTFYCRTGSTVRFFDSELDAPTFHCRPEQVVFPGGDAAPEDARWCHPDDYKSAARDRGPPVYADGPCAGETYPFFLDQHVELGLPGTR